MRDGAEVLEALRGYDVVVHAAALRGIQLDKYKSDNFWNLNVVGTRNAYEAARECGVEKVLLCSTVGIYGGGVRETGDSPVITEDLPLKPVGRLWFQQEVVRGDGGLLRPLTRDPDDSV